MSRVIVLGVIVMSFLHCFNIVSNKADSLVGGRKEGLLNEYYFSKNIDGGHDEPTESDSITALSEEQLVNLNRMICSNIRCKYMYFAMSHVYFCKSLSADNRVILATYSTSLRFHRWATQMLVTMYNVPRLRSTVSVMWIFYLYTHRVETSLASEEIVGKDTNTVVDADFHDEMLNVFVAKMQIDCPAMHGEFESYISGQTISTPSKMLLHNCIAAFGQLKSNIANGMTEKGMEFFGMDRLYLNNVADNLETMDTLTTKFGLMTTDGHEFSSYLVSTFKVVKDPKSTLQQQASSLYAVHFSFIAMLKIMMLRIHLKHLAYLKDLEDSEMQSAFNTKLYARLEEFVCLLHLKEDDEIKLYFDQQRANDEIDEDLLDGAVSSGSALLRKLCNSLDIEIRCWETASIKLTTPGLRRISAEYQLNMPIEISNHLVQKSVLCADVFVKYVGKILSGINFEVINSFMATQFF